MTVSILDVVKQHVKKFVRESFVPQQGTPNPTATTFSAPPPLHTTGLVSYHAFPPPQNAGTYHQPPVLGNEKAWDTFFQPSVSAVSKDARGGLFINVSSLNGRAFVLVAKDNRCPHCTALIPVLIALRASTGRDIYVLDAQKDQAAMALLEVRGYPTIFLVNKFGRIQGAYPGLRQVTSLEQALNALDQAR